MFERKKLDWGEGETSFIEIFDNPDKPGFKFAHATGFNALTSVSYTHLTLPTTPYV